MHLSEKDSPFELMPPNNDTVLHYENTPIQIYRKFHLKKLKISR